MSGDGIDRARELLKRAGLGDVSPKALVGVCAIAAVVIAAAVWRWAPRGGESFEIESGTVAAKEAPAETSVSPSAASQEPTSVIVHVIGAVRHPGVVEIGDGGRVADAVDAAGGLLSNAAPQSLNLARVVSDGEQVVVLTVDEWESGAGAAVAAGATAPGGAASGAGSAAAGAPVNLNSASVQDLDTLPGIGPSTAAKIVADREANGPFASAEDLMRVSGIGPKKFEALKDAIVVR